MPLPKHIQTALDLRPGEWVEVRSKEEILATLDGNGRLNRMPFMPEMLQFCGKRFRVSKRAEKSCDTIFQSGGRQVADTVHLDGVRCDGSAHGGCQALCLIWWREAWLKRVEQSSNRDDQKLVDDQLDASVSEHDLYQLTKRRRVLDATLYSCQATSMLDFSKPMTWWDPKPVAREVVRGNVTVRKALKVIGKASLNALRRRFGVDPKPSVYGKCDGRTPTGRIPGLQPGDWVEVKSKAEIEETLDRARTNRGLYFDIEALPYCGRKMKVRSKVERIIDERSGAMLELPNDCWILEGAVCEGYQSRNRLFCTRQIYSYWREIWLRPVGPPGEQE